MYKKHNFNSNQEKQIIEAYKELSKCFQLYELKSEIEFLSRYKPSIAETKQTIDYYHQNHNYLDIDSLNHLKSFINSIRHYDKLFRLDNKLMLFHTYKLISFIEKYTYILGLYERGNYYKNTYAILKGDKSKNLAKYQKHKKNMFASDNIHKGQDLVRAYISKLYYLHPEAMDMFINLQTLIPQHQLKEFQSDTLEVKMIKNLFKYYGSTPISSSKPILKSLAIVVAYYLKFKLNMPNKDILHSLELLFNDFYYEISDGKYLSPITSIKSHFFQNIYIRGRINMIPIFGSSEKELKNIKNIKKLDWLFKTSQKELNIFLDIPIKGDLHPIINPMPLFLSHTPIELLQQTR